jgi:hypothetical protein
VFFLIRSVSPAWGLHPQVTTQRPHLQTPSHWGLVLQCVNLENRHLVQALKSDCDTYFPKMATVILLISHTLPEPCQSPISRGQQHLFSLNLQRSLLLCQIIEQWFLPRIILPLREH